MFSQDCFTISTSPHITPHSYIPIYKWLINPFNAEANFVQSIRTQRFLKNI